MANIAMIQPAQLFKEYKRKKRWQRGVAVLSLAAFIATGSVLIRPAVTEEQPVYCGFTEHTHSEECYGEAPLVCTVEENHVHDGNCYQLVDAYVCGLEESEGHTHTEECYQEQSVLTCGLEETAGHTHTEQCYALQPVCTCGLDGIEDHVHDESCYTEQPVLVCGLEECAPHTHTDECYTIQSVPVCGLEESEGHTHTEECLGQTLQLVCEIPEGHLHGEECYGAPELVCTLQEHQHTDACYSNPNADLESAEVWESTVENLELKDNWRENIIKIAKSQLGYSESVDNFTVENSQRKGYTRYGAWYGIPYGDWCAMFASFCIRYAGVTEEAFPVNAGCFTWIDVLEELELYQPAGGEYQPQSGDLVFFDNDHDNLSDHVGLVSEIREATATETAKLITIEGNNGLTVAEFEYDLSSDCLLGYGVMPENPEENPEENSADPVEEKTEEITDENEENAEAEPEIEKKELVFEGEGFIVTLRYTEEAALPENVQLQVVEIPSDDERYIAHYNNAEAAMIGRDGSVNITGARLFDITLLSDGVEVEPSAAVEVEIKYTDGIEATENTVYTAVHFTDVGTELIEAEPVQTEEGVQGFAYQQDSFSEVMLLTSGDEDEENEETPVPTPSITTATTIPNFQYSKTIDYLGDEGKNSDTDLTGKDYYRLYLSITGISDPVDLVIVIDQSNSMIQNNCTLDGTSYTRKVALQKFLTGYEKTVSGKTVNVAGFVDRFMALNSNNKIAVVGYNGGMGANYGWYTASAADIATCKANINSLGNSSGTNYQAGFKRTYDKLKEVSTGGANADTNKKIVLFLSDGEPTVYYTGITDYDFTTVTDSSAISSISSGTTSDTNSWEAYKKFHGLFPDVKVYTIGMINSGATGETLLTNMATDETYGGNGLYFNVDTDITSMMKKLLGLFAANEIVITDVLSKFVRYYDIDPDTKVTMTDASGNATTLYEKNAVTTEGEDKVSSVAYVARDTSTIPTSSTGTVTATLVDSYPLSNGYTYTLSFNVKSTQTTYDYYEFYSKSYNGTVGDAGTDYGSNDTSSEDPGFYSNDTATVKFNFSETTTTKTYAKPVVQARFTDSATSANYMVLEKRFTGITADKIPADFTITVQSTNDPTLKYTLTSANATQTTDGTTIVWRWTLEGASAGTYTVTETNAAVDKYTLTTNYNGGDTTSITIAAQNVTAIQQNPITSVQNFAETTSGTPIFVGKTKSGNNVVISESRLPASLRKGLESLLAANYSSVWKSGDIFHYFETGSTDLVCGGESITYSSTDHTITLAELSNWTTAVTAYYDAAAVTANPELRVANSYEGTDVSLTVKNETPEDTDKVFTYTVSYVFDGVTTNLTGFTLKNGETYTVQDIPVGATVTVTEGDHGGFYVFTYEGTNSASKQSGDSISVTLNADGSITFYNNPGTVLPETGGIGSESFMIAGLILIEASLILLRRKRKAGSRSV